MFDDEPQLFLFVHLFILFFFFLWQSILLLQLLFSVSFVSRNEEASSPIIGNTDTAVIYNPCE